MKAVLMVNSKCNVSCAGCFIPYKGARSPEKTVEAVQQLQDRGHTVIIAGSETLLDVEYLKAYQLAGQDYLLTNGIRLAEDQSLYERLREHGIEQLTISLHSGVIGSVNEDVVGPVLIEAHNRGFRTQVTSIVNAVNYRQIDEMCERARTYKATVMQFNRFVDLGHNMGLSEAQILDVFEQVESVRKTTSKEELEIKLHGNFGPRSGSEGEILAKHNCYCPGGQTLVAITPDNTVYACPYSLRFPIGRFDNGMINLNRDLLNGRRDTCITHLIDKEMAD